MARRALPACENPAESSCEQAFPSRGVVPRIVSVRSVQVRFSRWQVSLNKPRITLFSTMISSLRLVLCRLNCQNFSIPISSARQSKI